MSFLAARPPSNVVAGGSFDLRDREEVEALVAADPAVTSGAMRAEIRPLRIVTR